MFDADPRQDDAFWRAQKELGTKEILGEEDNEKIVSWFGVVGHSWVRDDETAWCAAFLGAMLEFSGLESTRKLTARSYLEWGEGIPLDDAMPGDLVVFWRGTPNGWQGHVGFYTDHNDEWIWVLGGNQSNEVNIARYPVARLLGVRRMPAPPKPTLWETIANFLKGLFNARKVQGTS